MPDHSDVLSQLAAAFRLEGAMSGRFSLTSPWGYAVPKSDHAALLVVVRGRVYFELRGEHPRSLELGPGDVVALPHGDPHAVRDDPKTPLEEAAAIKSCPNALAERHRGGQTELLLLACRFSNAPGNTLLRALPPLIHYAGHDGKVARWLEPTIQLLANESAANEPGRAMILDRLAEVVFLQLVRTWLEDEKECKGWLRSLRDSRITEALGAMHTEPGSAWTVETLAARAGMSRSSFAGRFKELVGETPLDYLTRWRMQRAATMLETGGASVKEVVAASGYVSEAAFRQAFRKWMGVAPGRARRARSEDSSRSAEGVDSSRSA